MKIVHLLNQKLDRIKKLLTKIKIQEFDGIKINSMQPFKQEDIIHCYMSYQPLGFKMGKMEVEMI